MDTANGHYDIIIIGGGINGCGIARDAAMRGYRVLLLEKEDIAAGTSSKSSKLIHGGLRYLEHFELGLVREGLREREILMRIASHRVHPLTFVLPNYREDRHALWKLRIGITLYDLLSYDRSSGKYSVLNREKSLQEEPMLRPEGLRGALVYNDGLVEHAERLCLDNVVDAARLGADIRTHWQVNGFQRQGETITGVHAADLLTGTSGEFSGTVIINAAGPWADDITGLDTSDSPPLLRPTKGIHLFVDRFLDHALYITAASDGRMFFVIPWRKYTIVGTTDTDFSGDKNTVAAEADEIEYLLSEAERVLPAAKLRERPIRYTHAGLRPLALEQGKHESAVSRKHIIHREKKSGLLTIAGGKLTSYRSLAEETMDTVDEILQQNNQCRTGEQLLPGTVADTHNDFLQYKRTMIDKGEKELGLPESTTSELIDLYGEQTAAIYQDCQQDHTKQTPIIDTPYLLCQIDYAVQHEFARTVADICIRRLAGGPDPIFMGKPAEMIAGRMAKLLNWSPEETSHQLDAYYEELDRNQVKT